eukprot:gene4604-5750_t
MSESSTESTVESTKPSEDTTTTTSPNTTTTTTTPPTTTSPQQQNDNVKTTTSSPPPVVTTSEGDTQMTDISTGSDKLESTSTPPNTTNINKEGDIDPTTTSTSSIDLDKMDTTKDNITDNTTTTTSNTLNEKKISEQTKSALTDKLNDDELNNNNNNNTKKNKNNIFDNNNNNQNNNNIDITQTNLDEPRDSRVIKSILKTMGVQNHDPRVVNQLLEFMYKYVYEVLQDSVVYSEHSGKTNIDITDVRLAIQSRVNYSFTSPPPRELLLSIAEEKNKIPLPPIPDRYGILLPPDEYCLTNSNYQVNPPKPAPPATQTLVGNQNKGQYNKKIAEKQIPIKLSSNLPTTNGKHETTTTTSTSSTIQPPILPITSTMKPPVLAVPPTIKPPSLSAPKPTITAPPVLKPTITTPPPPLPMSVSTPPQIKPTLTTTPPTLTTTTTPPTEFYNVSVSFQNGTSHSTL